MEVFMIKLGCGTVLFRKFDLERSLDAIRNIGYEYFETQAVGPWCPHVNVETAVYNGVNDCHLSVSADNDIDPGNSRYLAR